MTQRQFSALVGFVASSVSDRLDLLPGLPVSSSSCNIMKYFRGMICAYISLVYLRFSTFDHPGKSNGCATSYLFGQLVSYMNKYKVPQGSGRTTSWRSVRDGVEGLLALALGNAAPEDTFRILKKAVYVNIHSWKPFLFHLARLGAFRRVVSLIHAHMESEIQDLLELSTRRLVALNELSGVLMRTAPFAPDECSLEKLSEMFRRYLLKVIFMLYQRYCTDPVSANNKVSCMGPVIQYAACLLGFESLEVVLDVLECTPEERHKLFDRYVDLSRLGIYRWNQWDGDVDEQMVYYLLRALAYLMNFFYYSYFREQKYFRYISPEESLSSPFWQSWWYGGVSFDMGKFPKQEEEMQHMDLKHYIGVIRRVLQVCDRFDRFGLVKHYVLNFAIFDPDKRWTEADGNNFRPGSSSVLLRSPEYMEFLEREVFPTVEGWIREDNPEVTIPIIRFADGIPFSGNFPQWRSRFLMTAALSKHKDVVKMSSFL